MYVTVLKISVASIIYQVSSMWTQDVYDDSVMNIMSEEFVSDSRYMIDPQIYQ